MKIEPKIPIIYKNKFPKNFVNTPDGWAFSEKVIKANKGKILTLDIDFGNYCSLNCPHCFRRNNKVDFGKNKVMQYSDIVKVIKDAKKLGLRSVKFLGAGEPFEDKRFIEFLRFLHAEKIIPVIFTKGTVIGDDELAKKWNSHYGINNGKQLVNELKKLNATILLGFNSFDTKVQDEMVGGIKGYTLKRNKALELLVRAGFNKTNPTRLCLAMNPITKQNVKVLLEMYKWARTRNLAAIITPTMVAGRCAKEIEWSKITPSKKELVNLYSKIYKWNLEKGISTIEQLKHDGVSAYAGVMGCNEVACGMYVTLTGKVLRCPGDDKTLFGDIWSESLKNIWLKSENYKRAGTFNCGCPPKIGKSIPKSFFLEVMAQLDKIKTKK
ncbi:MAG: Radical SAM domain protein [Parcubacteria group bacterium GW2011_GWC2_39_14]|nr:MAG: Radical SAM domain protein [Parcubacteria group bacterium GW2011_GWC2_39_14]KKR54116.1 MAG: Radical SAM domain protein [Parcubacteria group bacterium GW2011_GWA2_40_23]